MNFVQFIMAVSPTESQQESPAVADKPAQRKSMLKLLQFDERRAYNVVADNTSLSSFI